LAVDRPNGPSWRLDAAQAQTAWAGAESRFPAASRPTSAPQFAAWARAQSASGGPNRAAHLLPVGGRSERIAGAVGTLTREGRDVVAHNALRERSVREPAQSASSCHQKPSDVSEG